jgi:ligand-binding SRPBCC domain-containing protein
MSFVIAAQRFPRPFADVWKYCRDPRNLKHFCPPEMDFRIKHEPLLPETLRNGLKVEYHVRCLPRRLGLRCPSVSWTTVVPTVREHQMRDGVPRTLLDRFVADPSATGGDREFAYFVDRQVSGPYARWEHQHLFVQESDRGSLMVDVVNYTLKLDVPYLAPVQRFVVRPELEFIFRFRQQHLRQLFGSRPGLADHSAETRPRAAPSPQPQQQQQPATETATDDAHVESTAPLQAYNLSRFELPEHVGCALLIS